jgi:hypothetical protein
MAVAFNGMAAALLYLLGIMLGPVLLLVQPRLE